MWYRVSERPITETSIKKKDGLIETQTGSRLISVHLCAEEGCDVGIDWAVLGGVTWGWVKGAFSLAGT